MKKFFLTAGAVAALAVPAVASAATGSTTQPAGASANDVKIVRLFLQGEAAYKNWLAVKSLKGTTMLNAAGTLQASITGIRAELSVAHGWNPRVEAARKLMIQAYGPLLKAANLSEQMQQNALQSSACGGDLSCANGYFNASLALKLPLESSLVSWLSLSNAAIKTLVNR
jgi:hypothetical protein